MSESRYWFLTGKYLSKTITWEEQIELTTYLEANPANKQQFEEHIKLWESFSESQKELDFDSQSSWLELKALIADNEKQRILKIRPLFNWRNVAAAVILVLITTGIFEYLNTKSETIVLSTLANKQLFVLPDSTKVWLNKNTRLCYNSRYNEKQREVELSGEAYFEVRHNAGKPFIINSNQTFTKVLGTKFNVRSYDSDSAITVSVVQGKVQFGNIKAQRQALILTKDCIGTYMKNSEKLQKTISENPNIYAWQTNKLVFVNSSLYYVIRQLESYYNIHFNIKTPDIKNCSFSGAFDNQNLDEVIKILEFTLNLNFTKGDSMHYAVSGIKCSN
jgi:transmembrane sensor